MSVGKPLLLYDYCPICPMNYVDRYNGYFEPNHKFFGLIYNWALGRIRITTWTFLDRELRNSFSIGNPRAKISCLIWTDRGTGLLPHTTVYFTWFLGHCNSKYVDYRTMRPYSTADRYPGVWDNT